MALIEFKNKPNTDTPINDTNLNYNFKEIETNLSEINEKLPIIDSKNDYQTEEKIIGIYAGKTLYRKIITIGKNQLPNNHFVNIKHNIDNLDYIVNITGFIYENPITSATWFLPIPYASPTVGLITTACSRTELQIESSMNLLDKLANIIIEYTKTTD